ncbi:hypothetical protein BH23BAC4_BH23BAC4_06200 [soil metagenome]
MPESTPPPPFPGFHSRLDGGQPVYLRPIRPEDRFRLEAGLADVSDETLRHRFLAPVRWLSKAQLDYLTEVDHRSHVAWGALDPDHLEKPGLGIARFVRLPKNPTRAEYALTVIDDAQGAGLGTLLFAVLLVRARQEGINALVGYVGRNNERAARWMRQLGASIDPADIEEGASLYVIDTAATSLPQTHAAERLAARLAEVELAFGA